MLTQTQSGYIIKTIRDSELGEDKFDDSQDLLNEGENLINLFDYRIAYITICYDKEKEFIVGIQLTFRNLKQNEIIPLPRRLGKNWVDFGKGEMIKIQKKEFICYFSYNYTENGITRIHFETNKKLVYQKGKEIGDKVELIPDNKKRFNIILGTFGTIENLGIINLDIAYYIKINFVGYYELKLKLERDKEFKQKVESKYEELSEVNKYLYRAALLPETPFNYILKFISAEIY